MEWVNTMGYTKESTYISEEYTNRLKEILTKTNIFKILKPEGLMFSIPDDNIKMRIIDFRYKLNQEFQGNDSQFAAKWTKRSNGGSQWTYEIPYLQLNQGDKVHYWLYVKFDDVKGFSISVTGVLDITRGNSLGGGTIQSRTPVVRPPAPPGYGVGLTPSLGGGQGGGVRRGFTWNQQFNIDPPGNSRYTTDMSKSWSQYAELLKNSLQKDMDFQFPNPSGLTILIPDNNMRIVNFRVKLNEKFRDNDIGHFTPEREKREGRWSYYIPLLKIKPGDNIYYWMDVKFGNERFDATVRGSMEISNGDPYGQSMTIRPYPTPQTYSPTSISTYPTIEEGVDKYLDYKWKHRFYINLTTPLQLESRNKWLEDAELLKNSLKDDTIFTFYNPTGIGISISGNSKIVEILAFNIKINQEFQNFESGHYLANNTRTRDGRWNYYYPNLKLTQGDKLYYWMRVTIGEEQYDNTVNGVLEVLQGDPHIRGPYFENSGGIVDSPPTRTPINYPPTTYPVGSPPNIPVGGIKPQTLPGESPSLPSTTPCITSPTTWSGETSPCQGRMLLEDQFNNMNGWIHQVTIGGSYTEDEFTCFMKDSENSRVENGKLVINPTLLKEKYGDSFIDEGYLDLTGTCTKEKFCVLKATGYSIMPPVVSARLKSNIRFRFGKVEIRAKFPRGDWLVPELWLIPFDSEPEEKVVVGVIRGNRYSTSNQFEVGVVQHLKNLKRQPLTQIDELASLSDGFHDFKVEWTPEAMKFFVDNRQIHQLSTNDYPILRQEVCISLGLHVGGDYDFPDEMYPNKPWKNDELKRLTKFWRAKDLWYKTWDKQRSRLNSALQVEYVRITAI